MDKIGSGGDIPQRTLNCRKRKGLFMAKAQSHRKQETRKLYPRLAQRTIGSSAQVMTSCGWVRKRHSISQEEGQRAHQGIQGEGPMGSAEEIPKLASHQGQGIQGEGPMGSAEDIPKLASHMGSAEDIPKLARHMGSAEDIPKLARHMGSAEETPKLASHQGEAARDTVVCFPHQGETGGRRQVGTNLPQAGPLRQGASRTWSVPYPDQRGV